MAEHEATKILGNPKASLLPLLSLPAVLTVNHRPIPRERAEPPLTQGEALLLGMENLPIEEELPQNTRDPLLPRDE